MTRYVLLAAVVVTASTTGCDSIVAGACEPGMVEIDGHCRLAEGEQPDAGPGPSGVDARDPVDPTGADAMVCTADTETDPLNCGVCGHVCGTGICVDGECLGEVHGHAVVIGHDYAQHNAAMARVLGNAVGLSTRSPLRVATWRGTASHAATVGTDQALTEGLTQIGRAWTSVTAEDLASATTVADVIVIDAQRGAAADMTTLGASLAAPFATFIADGGVVVVLEGASGTSHDLATAANLATITAIATDTGPTITIGIATDGVATGVPQPYFGAASTVWFTTASPGVLVDDAGHPVAIHTTP